jgi:hypothetical protein
MFSAPPELLNDLRREVQQERTGEVYKALLKLLKPEPQGCRRELVQALVSCFAEHKASLDDLLTKLTSISPPVFEPLAVEIRCEGLHGLFSDPPTFVRVIAEGLSRADLSGETCVALELLAQPEPRGKREEMLQVLSRAQLLNAGLMRALLRQLRATVSSTLSRLVYDFNLRLLADDLSSPERFLSRVTEAIKDSQERTEVWQILRQLAASEPQGRKRELVQALGAARVTRPQEVDAILQETSWQPHTGLLGLSTQVKLFSFLCNVFSLPVASKIFALKS